MWLWCVVQVSNSAGEVVVVKVFEKDEFPFHEVSHTQAPTPLGHFFHHPKQQPLSGSCLTQGRCWSLSSGSGGGQICGNVVGTALLSVAGPFFVRALDVGRSTDSGQWLIVMEHLDADAEVRGQAGSQRGGGAESVLRGMMRHMMMTRADPFVVCCGAAMVLVVGSSTDR